MKYITKILFPTDFSDPAKEAFQYTLALARRFNASIKVIHVVQPEYESSDIPAMAGQMVSQKVEAAKEVLKAFIKSGVQKVDPEIIKVIEITSEVEVGLPSGAIASASRRDEIDLTVIGTKGVHNVWEKFFGSTTSNVIQKASGNILVVPIGTAFRDFKKIVYATDLSETDAYQILKVAQIMNLFEPSVDCIHVARRFNAKVKDTRMNELAEFFKEIDPGLRITFNEINNQSVSDGLVDFVEKHNADLLCMFAPNRTFFDRIFHNSLTQRMPYLTKIPMLILKNKKR